MPNIAITAYCNLKCPYCFANEMISNQEEKNITLEQFEKIIQWIPLNPSRGLGLIGGEPTLHPQFKEILEITERYLQKTQSHCVIFTNGVYIKKYIPYLTRNFNLLVNVNGPEDMGETQWNSLQEALNLFNTMNWLSKHSNQDALSHKAYLGCNICMERKDYSFIWEIIEKYDLAELRVSVTAPTKPEYKNNKHKYYTDMKPIFLDFVKKAKEHNLKLVADCNQIPLCYYTEEEKELVLEVMPEMNNKGRCGPVIDITADFHASSCFGAYELVDCNNFSSFENLEFYLTATKFIPRMINNTAEPCQNCPLHENLECQGGCLGFSHI